MGEKEETIAAYDAFAAEFAAGTAEVSESGAIAIEAFVSALGNLDECRVLEIGSGGGRDARALEERGLSVRRTDVSKGFVELLRAGGHEADVVDPLTDDLRDPQRPGTPYDGVWASASLLHVSRGDLATVLHRLAEVTRTDGPLYVSLKEGDGEGWSTHGHVGAPRHFTYWREPQLRAALAGSGWSGEIRSRTDSRGGPWLEVRGRRE